MVLLKMKRLLLVGACAFAVLMGAGIPTPLQPDGTTIISNNAVISCATATTSQIGCVKPDGATININGAGVISSSGGSATSVTVGTTTVGSGTNGSVLYDNSGVLGNETPSSLTTTATSSVSARTLAARSADIFNVKDYGALGTGIATTIGTTYGSSLSAVASYTTATGATPFSWMTNTAYGLTFSMNTSAAQGTAGTVLPFSVALSGNPSWSQSAPQFNGFWPQNQQYLVQAGMTVSGSCIQAGTTVASTAAANNGAKLTSVAQGSAGTTLTFLETVGLVVGQPVTGTNIPSNTTIASLTGTTVTLSNSTTSAVAAQAFIQFGEIANITLSVSTSSACASGTAITFALSNSQVQALTVDYVGLQSAFAAASNNTGGRIFAPSGIYESNRPVWNPGITNANAYTPAITFHGAGMYTTQISPTSDFGSGACAIGENNRSGSVTGYAEWADFRLVGPGTANTVGNSVASMDGLCVGAKALVRRVSAWQMNAGLNVLEDHQIIEDSDFGNDFYGIYLAPNGQNIGNQRIAKTPTIGNAKAGIATAWNNGLVSDTLSDSDTGGNSPYSFYGEAIPYGQTGYAVTMIGYSVIQNMLGENVGNAYIYCEGNATTGCIVSNNTFIGGQPVVQLSSSSSYRLSGLAPRAVIYVNQFLYNTLVNADFSDVGANFALVSHGIFEGEFQGNSFGDQTVMMTNLSATVPAMITDNFGLTTGSSYNNTFKVNNASGEWRAIENNPATVGELLTYGTGYNYIGALAMTVGSQPLGVSIAAGASGSLIPVVERGFVSVAKTAGTGIAKGAQACVSSSTPTSVTACSASAGGNQFTIGSTVITAASGDTTASIDAQIVFVPSTATTSLQGIVQPDGSTITISSGVISASSAVTTASISAAGTTQGTATSIAAQDVVVTSGSGTAYGVVLPAVTGIRYVVRNRSGVSISVYPPGSAQIENGGASAPAILPSGSDATYISYVSGQWYS